MLPENAHRNARQRKAWLDRKKEIITPESVCSACGKAKTPLQIHHITIAAYKEENFHLYETLSPDLPYCLICKTCHYAEHKGMVICRKCRNAYHGKQFPTCFACSGKEETEDSKIMHIAYEIIRNQ